MKAVLDDFALRVQEARSFLRMLSALEGNNAHIGPRGEGTIPVQDDWRRVSKAAAFLVLYNLIEAAIRSAFTYLYDEVQSAGCTAAMATGLLREVWIEQRYRRLTREGASPSNYRDAARQMVSAVIEKAVLELDADKLPVSGNLDAQAIRELCDKHGIACKTPKRAKGGSDLQLVKAQRNALAHGNRTFAECGRDITVADLERITQQVESFIRAVLRSIDRHVRTKAFLRATVVRRPGKAAARGRA